MKQDQYQALSSQLYFRVEDVAHLMTITPGSARVLCARYAAKGVFTRLKNNFYMMSHNWQHLRMQDFYKISNFLQVPSYISFMSALSFYGVTTQVQREFVESAAVKRSIHFDIKNRLFYYYKMKERYPSHTIFLHNRHLKKL